MKTNHQRGFVADNDKNRLCDKKNGVYHHRTSRKRDQRFFRKSTYADVAIGATPGGYDGSGKRLQRGIHGAKHYVRSRIRFHEKQALRKEIKEFMEDYDA